MHTQLLNHIERYVKLTDADRELICRWAIHYTYKKKGYLLEEGKPCPGNFFILEGCVRQYYVNSKLNEQIINFGLETWWIADHESLMTRKPSTSNIQAIEKTEALLLPLKDQAELFAQVPQLETYFRLMIQRAFVASQRRIAMIFNMSDEERYRNFTTLFPAFIQRVPQYMVASYLGITPQFVSRLRRKS